MIGHFSSTSPAATAVAGETIRALPAGYGYVGLLGSKRRRETLLAELGGLGLLEDPAITDRLYAPVDLDLGGHHPETPRSPRHRASTRGHLGHR